MSGPFSFDGRVAVVTGAGRGLGRIYAVELARRGASVVINDLAENPEYVDGAPGAGGSLAEVLAREITDGGGRAIAVHDSVSTPAGGEAIIGAAVEAFGHVDVVIHNAGNRHNARFEDMTPEMIDSVLDVHLRGGFWITKPAWPIMQERDYGRIVLTGSNVGSFGLIGLANYAAAKSGLIGLGRILALEGAEHGIKANTVLPVAVTVSQADRPAGRRHVRGIPERLREVQPTGDRGRPELVEPLVTYLASEACAVSGRTYSAVGGRFARVFMGVTTGWTGPADPASPEDIAAHLDDIEDPDGWFVPESAVDELESVAGAIADRT